MIKKWHVDLTLAGRFRNLSGNVLPTNSTVVQHYFYLWKTLTDSHSKFLNKTPNFADIRNSLVNDIAVVWNKASLPILTKQGIADKLKNLISQFEAARKRAKRRKLNEVNEEWLQNLFDISKCKCMIDEHPKVRNKKLLCSCDFPYRIPEKEIAIIIHQRNARKLIIGHVDGVTLQFRHNDCFTFESHEMNFQVRSSHAALRSPVIQIPF